MEYKIGNTVNAIYLQAKHLIVAKQISFETFFNDEKFHLYKYFTSFQEIKSGIVQNLGFMIKEVILCTNDQVSLASGSKNILFLKSSTFDLTLVFEKIENHEIFGNEGMNLKLLDSNVKLLRDMFIALELVKLLFGKDKDHQFYLLNHLKSFCFQKIFNVGVGSIKFKDQFLKGGASVEMDQFRACFELAVKSKFIRIPFSIHDKIESDFWGCFRKYKFHDTAYNIVSKFQDDNTVATDKIKSFTEHFRVLTDFKKSQIDDKVRFELRQHLERNYDLADILFFNSLKCWLSGENRTANIRKKIDREKVHEILNFSKVQENEIKLEFLKQIEFKEDFLIFCELNRELIDFLNNSTDKIVIYETFERETHWASLVLFQRDNSILYVNTGQGEYDNALEILKTCSSKKKVVIECTKKLAIFESVYLSQFIDLVKGKIDFKLIFICECNKSEMFGEYNLKKITQNKIYCNKINNNSLNLVLQTQLNFQGVELQLKDLICIDQLKKLPLSDVSGLKTGIEVGIPLENPSIYLPREMYRKIQFDASILNEKFSNDIIVCEETDFLDKIRDNPKNKSIHLMEIVYSAEKSITSIDVPTTSTNGQLSQHNIEKVFWKKSTGSIKAIRRFLSTTSEKSNFQEDFFHSYAEQLVIIEGVSGIGKSEFGKKLCFDLKQTYKSYWVQNIDLNKFSKELNKYENCRLVKQEEIETFFIENFMKADNELESEIATALLEKGRAIIFMDGYDEVCSTYQSSVIEIVSALIEISQHNKFYISTRPEWCPLLEEKFLNFSISHIYLNHSLKKIKLAF